MSGGNDAQCNAKHHRQRKRKQSKAQCVADPFGVQLADRTQIVVTASRITCKNAGKRIGILFHDWLVQAEGLPQFHTGFFRSVIRQDPVGGVAGQAGKHKHQR